MEGGHQMEDDVERANANNNSVLLEEDDFITGFEKNIPVGAGLGGGSADAAALLRAVNTLSTTPLGSDALNHLAASLGADVPACLAGGCQRIAGIGETMTPVDLDFAGSI